VGLGACGSTATTATKAAPAKAPTSVAALSGMTPAAVFARASATPETPRTARFTMTSTAAGTPGVGATGMYQRGTETAMRMTIDLSTVGAVAGVPLRGQLDSMVVGGAMYLRLVGANTPLGRKWTKITVDDLASASGQDLGWLSDAIARSDPQRGVDLVRHAPDLADLGAEVIDGVPTHHYRGTVDAATMIENLGTDAGNRRWLRQSLRAAGVTGSVQDIWVDGDFHIRRSVNRQQSNDGEFSTTLTFTGFDEPISVTAPAGSDVRSVPMAEIRTATLW
jgi:hypothetical protein